MSATVISFPARRTEVVEVEKCFDPKSGLPLYVFEVITRDNRRVGIGIRNTLEEAADDVAWFRRGGVPVVAIGMGDAA